MVVRKVPLRIVGSSVILAMRLSTPIEISDVNIRGMMVRRLLRSVSPIFEMSTPSIKILPAVGSTNLKNDNASVLLPDPVLPRIPIYS